MQNRSACKCVHQYVCVKCMHYTMHPSINRIKYKNCLEYGNTAHLNTKKCPVPCPKPLQTILRYVMCTHRVCCCCCCCVCCFTKAFSVIRFVFINFTLVFPYSQFVVVHLSHSLSLLLTHRACSHLASLLLLRLAHSFSCSGLTLCRCCFVSFCPNSFFFFICFNVLFAVHVIAYRPKTKATNINKC